MTAYPEAELLVFAKAPVAGQVKTRLAPAVGETEAAALHEWLALRTLHMATRARVAPVSLWCSPHTRHPFFRACRSTFDITLRTQRGRDLGERMANAVARTLAHSRYALLIGTDCPLLSCTDLVNAFAALQDGCDAVLGPAEDGGYVLIGLRRDLPELFCGVEWGSEWVLAQTRGCLSALGLRWHELPARWDVDRPVDLERLRRELASEFPQDRYGGDP